MISVKLIAVSKNTNVFGMRSHLFVSQHGEVFTGWLKPITVLPLGMVVKLDCKDVLGSLTKLGFEIAERQETLLSDAAIVAVWS